MPEAIQPIILVTGATDGLGRRVAEDLAGGGAKLLLHGRNPAKGQVVLEEIRKATGNTHLSYYNGDLSSLAEVRRLAEEIIKEQPRLNVLINNAAIGGGPDPEQRQTSQDGYELRLAVNYLAPFLLTRLLLPLLQHTAEENGISRIVNVSSGAQISLDFDDPMLERDYEGKRAYSQSKLALVMFTFDLAQQLAESRVTVNALHPASFMDTKMVREWPLEPQTKVETGARAVEYLVKAPELEGTTGQYFQESTRAFAADQAYDEGARQRLWRLSEEWTRG
jgi:NAD(P)-dependent dehydrogenase (short-subunit alcohol dehydrogenase family)